MTPPAAINTLFNTIARREALPAGPVVDFDTALPPLGFQVEPKFLRKTSFRFLAPAASSNFPPPPWVGVEADTVYGSARTPAVQRCGGFAEPIAGVAATKRPSGCTRGWVSAARQCRPARSPSTAGHS